MQGDITDRRSVEAALDGCEGVLHAAAVVAVSRRRAAEVLATNAAGTRNVVGGAVDAGLGRIVHTSSVSALFSAANRRVTPDTEVAEPDSAYGKSKAEAELFVRGLQDQGATVTIIYPGGVLGPHDPNPTLGAGHGAIVTNYRSGTPIIQGGGWSIVDVRDVADLYVAAFGPDPAPSRPGARRSHARHRRAQPHPHRGRRPQGPPHPHVGRPAAGRGSPQRPPHAGVPGRLRR